MEIVLQYGTNEKTVDLPRVPQLRDRVKVGGRTWQVSRTIFDVEGDEPRTIVKLVGGS